MSIYMISFTQDETETAEKNRVSFFWREIDGTIADAAASAVKGITFDPIQIDGRRLPDSVADCVPEDKMFVPLNDDEMRDAMLQVLDDSASNPVEKLAVEVMRSKIK